MVFLAAAGPAGFFFGCLVFTGVTAHLDGSVIIEGAAGILPSQYTAYHCPGTADTRVHRYGLCRTIPRAGAAFHAKVSVQDAGHSVFKDDDPMGAHLGAH